MIPMRKTSRSLSLSDQRYIGNHTIDPPAIQLSQRQLELRNNRRHSSKGGSLQASSPPAAAAANTAAVEDDMPSLRGNRNKRSPRNLLRISPRNAKNPAPNNDDKNDDDLARQRALVRSMMRRKESTPKEKSERFIRNVLERALESTKKKPKDPPITPQRQRETSPVSKPKLTAAMEVKARKTSSRVPAEISARQSVKFVKAAAEPERKPSEPPAIGATTGIAALPRASSASESFRASSVKSTTGYREFVRNLANEASGSHSYLVASMETAISGQPALVEKSKKSKNLDSTTRERVAGMNNYLKAIPCERHECQLKQSVSDRDYDKARKKSKQPVFSTQRLVRVPKADERKVKPKPDERKVSVLSESIKPDPQNTKHAAQTRQPLIDDDEKKQSLPVEDPRKSVQSRKSEHPREREELRESERQQNNENSRKSEQTNQGIGHETKWFENENIQQTLHQSDAARKLESKTVRIEAPKSPEIINVEVTKAHENHSENTTPKKPSFLNKNLRSVKLPPPQAPEAPAWTKIQLKPVKREQPSLTEPAAEPPSLALQDDTRNNDEHSTKTKQHSDFGQTRQEEHHEIIVVDPVPEDESESKPPASSQVTQSKASSSPKKKTFKEFPFDQILLSLPLQDCEGIGATRAVLGKQTIKCVQEPKGDAAIDDCVVAWSVDRDEIEPDGINLSMAAFCIVMLLSNGEQVELLFQNSEDCLRFVSAFYDAASVPPEVSENVSVNSSVRLESLNDEEQSVLERYRELRQTRPPMTAMAEIITEDSALPPTHLKKAEPLDARQGLLQQLLLQKSSSNETKDKPTVATDASKNGFPEVVSAQDLPSSPVSTFTSTSIGTKTVSATLNEAETLIANKYILMMKRGVPIEAVEHSLKKDGVDSKIASVVLSSTEDNGTQPAGPSTEKESPIVKKYKQMLKMGIPGEAVRHRMVKDGIEESIMSIVLATGGNPVETPSDQPVPSRKSKLSPAEEAEVAKYRKLLKLQVSKEALLSRMQNERVEDKVIEAVLGKFALSQGKSQKSSAASTSSKLINLHWNAMDDVPAGSVWEQGQSSFDLEKSDIHSLVEQFQKKPTSSKQGPEPKDKPNLGAKAKLLDVTRANNVAISLKAFKDFSYKELAEIVGFLDPCRKVLGERAQFIRDLLPTAKESTLIMKYQGPDDRLGPAEQWFRQLQGIKRIDTKAQVIRTMEFFSSEVSVIRNNFRLLSQVCIQIQRSTKLVDVLKMVLKVGNTMNAGTRSGDAAGFRFDSLLRLTQTKTTDGKMSVLDYIVSVFVEKGQRETLDLVSDFPELHTVSRFLIVDMQNEVKTLGESLARCKQELQAMDNDMNASTKCQAKTAPSAQSEDPRNALFASIVAQRNKPEASETLPTVRNENFAAKRDDFLAAIDSKRRTPSETTFDSESRRSSNSLIENNFQGGMTRLRQFIDSVDDSFTRLQKQKDEALQCSKDVAKYCGETSGVGATGPLLDTLSKFTRNVETALTTYDERQVRMSTKKKKDHKKSYGSRQSLDERSTNLPEKDGRSLILMVNDVLKSANPSFKEDFKKGRKLSNPSEAVKAIYEKEATVEDHIQSGQSVDSHAEWDCNVTAALTTSTEASTCQSAATPSPRNSASSPTNTEVIGAALEVIKSRTATEQSSSELHGDHPSSNTKSLSARALHKRQMRSLTPKLEEKEVSDQPNAGESSTARLARMKRIQMRQGT